MRCAHGLRDVSSPKAEYLKWRRGTAVGCTFARLIAGRPEDFGQHVVVVASGGSPSRVAGNIARRVDDLVNDSATAAGVLLLPELTQLPDLGRVALALGNRPLWNVTTSVLARPPTSDMIGVHIVRQIPFGKDACPSEALVFGPFKEFPPTRRVPVTAIEIYVGEPRENDPKTGEPSTKANLAHMDVFLPTRKAFEKMWEGSSKGRAKSLGGEDNRAKAKVSLVLPKALATEIGCKP